MLYCTGGRYPIVRDPDEAFKRATRCSHEPEKNHHSFYRGGYRLHALGGGHCRLCGPHGSNVSGRLGAEMIA